MWELKTKPQWVMWKYETVKGKKQKVLYSAMTKRRCGANGKYSKAWVPYEEAVRAAAYNGMEGVGFVVPKGYVAFDFDHCVQDDPMLKRAHELLPSYTEKSPSGDKREKYMKVLVIPDIHLKTWIFDRAENILKAGKADRAVCLMDMPDDWDMEFQIERYREIFDRAIAFAASYPDTLWCYGNHDVSYPWGRLETGYSPYAERTVMSKLEELENSLQDLSQINIMHRIDKVLFSHGGLTVEFLKWLNEDLLDADIDDVIAAVNDASHYYLWNDESPLWLRPQNKTRETFRADVYKRVVGHTPVERIFEKDGIISTDVFSTYRDGTQIGESAMIVIDSETGEYEKIEVMGKLGYKIETVSVIDE